MDAARKRIVEPVFGRTKSARGIRRFLLRGLANVSAGWQLICLKHGHLKIRRRSCRRRSRLTRIVAAECWAEAQKARPRETRAACGITDKYSDSLQRSLVLELIASPIQNHHLGVVGRQKQTTTRLQTKEFVLLPVQPSRLEPRRTVI